MVKKKASSLEISDIRVKYDKNDGSLRITSKDPDLKGKPFSLTITGASPTAHTIFKLMRENGLIEEADLPTKLDLKGREEIEAFYDPKRPLLFTLGETYDKELATIDLSNLPHMLVSGGTGAGKSVLLRSLVKQIRLRDNFELTVFDPTDVQWTQADLRPKDRILRSNEDLAEELERLDNGLYYRLRSMQTESVNHAASTSDQPAYKILIIDNASYFFNGDGIDVTDGVAVAKHELAKQRLMKLLQVGRSIGVHVIFSTQRVNFSELLNSIPVKIAMGSSGYLDTVNSLGDKPAFGQGLLSHHGRGVLSVYGEQTLFQAYYVSPEQ